ncbi:Spy0128 family protein [Enterococcus dongliensis]|uniref:Spy0128 family protein n=1 Tax=Enterococcus dongliensis TaxID=2559925 RepID=UPI002891185A|nr:FctA domain-containing protein [Enterococcus dongliensis]MDT2614684.1 FctA domain-containing protein [Enterococcus dongliensis]
MRRRISTLFSLFVIWIGVLIIPVSAFAETINSSVQSTNSLIDTASSAEPKTVANSENLISSQEQETQSTAETSDNKVPKSTDEVEISESPTNSEVNSRAPAPRKMISNIVNNVSIMDADGNPLTTVNQYTSIYVSIDFSLPNNEVSGGDQTTITLPDILDIERSFTFNVTNENGDIIAVATADSETDTVTLTYTDFVETHSDVSGHLSIASIVDTTVIENESDNPIYIDVNGEQIYGGDIHYEGEGDDPDEMFSKYSWFTTDEGTDLFNVLRVNPIGEEYSDVTIDDILKTEGLSYIKDSFKIQVGNWELNSDNIWSLNFSDGSFSVHLGDIGTKEYQITYHTKVDYEPVNGETFSNYARMTDHQTTIEESESNVTYQTGSGEADGSNYTINVHKENETNHSLPGAEFEVIRNRTGQVVGTITTDSNGEAKIEGLLKDEYTLRETQAPDGYILSNEEYHISPDDFGTDKAVLKTVVNKKKESSPTQIVFQAKKILTGRELQAGEFTFELKDENGEPIEETTNDGNGSINFSEISYDKAGTYTYTIQEVKGNETGVSYDNHVINVMVDVKDEAGELVATATYDGAQTFNNTYQPATGNVVLQAKKILIGRGLQAGEFTFELKDENGEPIEKTTNDGNGAINFSEISYDKAGTYTYTIQEVKGNETGISYDDHVINVTVDVKDEAGELVATATYDGAQTFKNKYLRTSDRNTPSSRISSSTSNTGKFFPQTGERTAKLPIFLGILLLVIVVLFIVKRKKSKQ